MSDRHLAPVAEPDLEPDDDHGHAPPQDLAAEIAVLGAMMRDRRALADVRATLQPGDFYRPAHEVIFAAILELDDQGDTPDPILLAEHLAEQQQLGRAGGPAYLHHLWQSVAVTSNADHYAEIVRERAALRRLVEAGTRIVAMGYGQGEGDVADLWARAEHEIARGRDFLTATDPDATSWTPLDLAEIIANGETIDAPAILPRSDGRCLFYRGAVHSVSGEPESGKTWLCLFGVADELKKGEHATVVDFEDRPGRVVGRLLALGVPPEAIRDRFHYIRPSEALNTAAAAALEETVVTSTLVVLDGVTEAMSLHGLDLNDQKDIADFLHMLPRRLADLGPAVVQIDHIPKNTEQGNRFAIGGQHKLAGLDGAAYMVKVAEPFARGKVGRARVTVVKDREGGVREHASGNTVAEMILDSSGFHGGLRYTLDAPHGVTKSEATGEFRPTGLMEKISRAVEIEPGMSGKAIEVAVKGRTDYKRLALKTLVAEGYFDTEAGPRGAMFYTSANPYREANDEQA